MLPHQITQEDLMICARTVYGEARNQDAEGRKAVAHVMINRWKSREGQFRLDHTLAASCLRWMQFSAWNPNDPNRIKMQEVRVDAPIFRRCLISALEALDEPDNTEGALHYKTKAARPRWAIGHVPCATHGDHQFYNTVK